MGNGMNKVLPGLYVGNFRDSKDPEQLRENHITHILAIHDNARKLPCNNDKEHLCIMASDSPGQNLTQFFPACNDFIHSARIKGGSVLIHCLAGMSRSVTVAVIYIMSVTTLNYKDSLKAVIGARNVANPNAGFMKQLSQFESDRLNDERRRLREKYSNYSKESMEVDEKAAQNLLARYHHSLSLGETCDGDCPVGFVCPRGLCHQRRRSGLFRHTPKMNQARTAATGSIQFETSSLPISGVHRNISLSDPSFADSLCIPPHPPSRNRITVQNNPMTASPTLTSAKHGINHHLSSTRNYSYYTSSSSVEITPPGSPSRNRSNGGKNQSTVISNKNNTIVWHQATPPSSPKRSNRKVKTPSPKTIPKEIKVSKHKRNSSDSKLHSGVLKSSTKVSSDFKMKDVKIKEENASGKYEKEKIKPVNDCKIISPQIIVKITSPTSPFKEENDNSTFNLNKKSTTLERTKENLLTNQNTEIDRNNTQKKNYHRHTTKMDEYSECMEETTSVVTREHMEDLLQQPNHENYIRLDDERYDVHSLHRNAHVESTFNSATLNYGTLYYSPMTKTSDAFVSMKSISSGSSSDSVSVGSHHIIRLPNERSSSRDIQNIILKNSLRANNASRLRQKFASSFSKSLDSDEIDLQTSCSMKEASTDSVFQKSTRAPSMILLKGESSVGYEKIENGDSCNKSILKRQLKPKLDRTLNSYPHSSASKRKTNSGSHLSTSIMNENGNDPYGTSCRVNSSFETTLNHRKQQSNKTPRYKKLPPLDDSNSPPTTRLCRIPGTSLSSKSTNSNGPSWMRQTFSRLMKSSNPQFSKRQTKMDQI